MKSKPTRQPVLLAVRDHARAKNEMKDVVARGDTDAGCLAAIAEKSYGDAKTNLVVAALRLDPSVEGPTRRILLSDDSPAINVALAFHLKTIDKSLDVDGERLFLNDDDRIRVVAVAFLVSRNTDRYLEGVLDRYVHLGTYYYNVVTWLDRALFAPEPLRSHFRAALQAHLNVRELNTDASISGKRQAARP